MVGYNSRHIFQYDEKAFSAVPFYKLLCHPNMILRTYRSWKDCNLKFGRFLSRWCVVLATTISELCTLVWFEPHVVEVCNTSGLVSRLHSE